MNSSIHIRHAESSDISAIADVIVPIQREEFGIDITYEQQPDLVDIKTFYQTGNGGFWVAGIDGDIVGTVVLKDIGQEQVALRKMFVKPKYRGKAHGVAQALLEHVIAQAKDNGIREIYLGTTPQFLAAHRFYEKNGFEKVEPEELPAAFPRMDVDDRFYKMELT